MIIFLCIFVIPFLKYNLEVLYHDDIYLHSLAIGQSHAVAFSGMQCLQCPAEACCGVACSRLLLQGHGLHIFKQRADKFYLLLVFIIVLSSTQCVGGLSWVTSVKLNYFVRPTRSQDTLYYDYIVPQQHTRIFCNMVNRYMCQCHAVTLSPLSNKQSVLF